MTHSPAPWSVYEDPGTNVFNEPINLSVIDADGFTIGECQTTAFLQKWFRENLDKHWGSDPASHKERMMEEVLANARMWAAAPELLEACRNVLNSLRDTEAFFSESPNTQAMVLSYLCNQVGAAIGKAEGK